MSELSLRTQNPGRFFLLALSLLIYLLQDKIGRMPWRGLRWGYHDRILLPANWFFSTFQATGRML